MKIKQMYLEDFIKECEKLGFKVEYNDETGIYNIPELNIRIKKWNGKIETGADYRIDNLIKFLNLYQECRYYIVFEVISDNE